MAYNNGFPVGYQQYQQYPQYFPTQPTVPQTQQAQTNGLIWIQGEAAAKSYLVAPGTTVALWDSESQTIYLKSADASGMPSMRTLDYTIREMAQAKNPVSGPEYATKEDLEKLRQKIAEIKESLKGADK